MPEPITKERLLADLRAERAAWDALLARVPAGRLTEPGAAGAWSVKDIAAHLTYYEKWLADRLHEQLRGESYTPTELDFMGEGRNALIYEQFRDTPPDDILAASRRAFDRLVAGVEAHHEAFLVEPQQFAGAPFPVTVGNLLRSEVIDHYGVHARDVATWLASTAISGE